MNLKHAAISMISAAALLMTIPATSVASADPSTHGGVSGTSDLRREHKSQSADSLGDPVLCGVEDLSVPESSSAGVVSGWLSYGESLSVSPYSDQIWAGVWFTGWNGPQGWSGTSAPSYYPAPGTPEYSLVARIGNGAYTYVGSSARTFTNSSPGYLMRVRFKVNDNTPGNGAGAFRAFLRYPCH